MTGEHSNAPAPLATDRQCFHIGWQGLYRAPIRWLLSKACGDRGFRCKGCGQEWHT